MSTQVIDFNNVENVFFGNKEVETLKLNDNVIWEGFKKLEQLIDRSIVSVSAEDLGEVTSIGNRAFCGCTNLTSVTIPSSVTSISALAFSNCTSLTNITIPSSVTSIGEQAFYKVALTSVTIPSSVTNIYSRAFYECPNLTTMKVLPTTPPTLADYDAISRATTRIEVPNASLSAYQEAPNWSSYANIMVGV